MSPHPFPRYERLTTIGLILAALAGAPAIADESRWQSEMQMAQAAHARGNMEQAVVHLEAALAMAEDLGPDERHGETLLALGTVNYDNENLEAARSLLAKAIASFEATLGPNHPKTANAAFALALTHSRERDYEAAEPLFQRALAGLELSRGAGDLSTLPVMQNLAGILVDMARFEEALALYDRAIPLMERSRGANHPDLGQLLLFQATALRALERTAEANAVEIRANQILGLD